MRTNHPIYSVKCATNLVTKLVKNFYKNSGPIDYRNKFKLFFPVALNHLHNKLLWRIKFLKRLTRITNKLYRQHLINPTPILQVSSANWKNRLLLYTKTSILLYSATVLINDIVLVLIRTNDPKITMLLPSDLQEQSQKMRSSLYF